MNIEDPVEDHLESFEETEIESVEMEYDGGELNTISITATYKRGSRDKRDTFSGEHVDTQHTIQTIYTVRDDEVELKGFYPDTSRTGRDLYRETLRCLNAMKATEIEVNSRVDDDMTVISPTDTVLNTISD